VATGESIYYEPDGQTERTRYSNIFVCRFDDEGRCREFTERYMRRRPEPAPDEPPDAG